MNSRRDIVRSGFTLVELLVVIAIIGILVALLLPAIQAAREAARRTECTNHLKQIGIALQVYHDTAKAFPMGRDRSNELGTSWAFRILPQLEEQAVYSAFVAGKAVYDDANSTAMRTPIEVYACPSRRAAKADRNFDNNDHPPLVTKAGTLGDYAANAGHEVETGMENLDKTTDIFTSAPVDTSVAGPIYSGSRINARRVTDGLSSTLAVGEKFIGQPPAGTVEERVDQDLGDTAFLAGDNRYSILRESNEGIGADPSEADLDSREKFGGPHPGVTMFVYLDGHTEALSSSIEIETFQALSTIAGGEVIKR